MDSVREEVNPGSCEILLHPQQDPNSKMLSSQAPPPSPVETEGRSLGENDGENEPPSSPGVETDRMNQIGQACKGSPNMAMIGGPALQPGSCENLLLPQEDPTARMFPSQGPLHGPVETEIRSVGENEVEGGPGEHVCSVLEDLVASAISMSGIEKEVEQPASALSSLPPGDSPPIVETGRKSPTEGGEEDEPSVVDLTTVIAGEIGEKEPEGAKADISLPTLAALAFQVLSNSATPSPAEVETEKLVVEVAIDTPNNLTCNGPFGDYENAQPVECANASKSARQVDNFYKKDKVTTEQVILYILDPKTTVDNWNDEVTKTLAEIKKQRLKSAAAGGSATGIRKLPVPPVTENISNKIEEEQSFEDSLRLWLCWTFNGLANISISELAKLKAELASTQKKLENERREHQKLKNKHSWLASGISQDSINPLKDFVSERPLLEGVFKSMTNMAISTVAANLEEFRKFLNRKEISFYDIAYFLSTLGCNFSVPLPQECSDDNGAVPIMSLPPLAPTAENQISVATLMSPTQKKTISSVRSRSVTSNRSDGKKGGKNHSTANKKTFKTTSLQKHKFEGSRDVDKRDKRSTHRGRTPHAHNETLSNTNAPMPGRNRRFSCNPVTPPGIQSPARSPDRPTTPTGVGRGDVCDLPNLDGLDFESINKFDSYLDGKSNGNIANLISALDHQITAPIFPPLPLTPFPLPSRPPPPSSSPPTDDTTTGENALTHPPNPPAQSSHRGPTLNKYGYLEGSRPSRVQPIQRNTLPNPSGNDVSFLAPDLLKRGGVYSKLNSLEKSFSSSQKPESALPNPTYVVQRPLDTVTSGMNLTITIERLDKKLVAQYLERIETFKNSLKAQTNSILKTSSNPPPRSAPSTCSIKLGRPRSNKDEISYPEPNITTKKKYKNGNLLKSKTFKCPLCPSVSTTKGNYERHHRLKHLNQKPFRCELKLLDGTVCGHVTSTASNMASHHKSNKHIS